MKIFTFVLVLLFSLPAVAQQERELEPDLKAGVTKVTYYHSNGEISQTGYFDAEGRLHGDWESFDLQGQQLAAGTYFHGTKTGKWMFWNADKLTEVDFSGNRITNSTEWHTACTLAHNK